MFCKPSVEVQTVAITSEYARDVVFKTFTKYDTMNAKLWLESLDQFLGRVERIGFVPRPLGRQSRCQLWKYILIDPVDGQEFQNLDLEGGSEAGCEFPTSTEQYAQNHARSIRFATYTTIKWYRFAEKRQHFQGVLTKPIEVSDSRTAHFQRFDDGWRLTGLN